MFSIFCVNANLEKLYLLCHYHYFRCKWSRNDNIIVYRNNFMDNLSSSKLSFVIVTTSLRSAWISHNHVIMWNALNSHSMICFL